MKSIWQNRSLTVVIFPQGEAADVFEVMKSWTSDRLLGPFLSVLPENVELRKNQPASVKASIFGVSDTGDLREVVVDLFDELARHEFDVVRLLAVRVLRSDKIETESFRTSVENLAQYVQNSLPLPSSKDDARGKRTRLMKINLVVSPTESHEDSFKSTILDTWNLNVIASPEDRSTPWSGDAFVRDDERFSRFVAMHVASIGGLWNGLSSGPFEILERENSQQGTIWVARVFVNSVKTDGLSRRIAARALREIGDPNSDTFDPVIGVEIPGTVMIPDQEAEKWVDWMVQVVFQLDNGALTFSNPMEGTAPEKERWFEWQQIKSFFVFAWDKVKVIPWWIWVWIRRWVGRTLTSVFQGSTGNWIVGIEQADAIDSRDKLVRDKIETITSLNDQAKKALAAPFLSTATRSNPALWNGIRKLVFSMLDASNRQEFVKLEEDQRIPVFSRVSQVIEDPKKVWPIDPSLQGKIGITELEWKNLENLPKVAQGYEDYIASMKREKELLISSIVQIDEKLSNLPVRQQDESVSSTSEVSA